MIRGEQLSRVSPILRRALTLCMLVWVILCIQGCSTRLLDYSAVTSKNIDVSGLKRVGRYTGEDCRWIVLFIPTGIPNWKTGVDEALEKGGGDVLLDTVLTQKGWWFLVGQSCVEVTGTVARSASYNR